MSEHRQIIAILRGLTPPEAINVCTVLVEAGITMIEVPLNSPEPFKSIAAAAKALAGRAEIGCGTALSVEDVEGTKNAGGSFVVGDLSDTGSVLFWGAQWATSNSLSGGSAPRAFKGFEDTPPAPGCGTNWTTDPGNSTPPPAGPLPAYMAVIVSSSISKSGSTISGNTPQIVIVRTNPGYDSNPGHAGTGTVVAQVC